MAPMHQILHTLFEGCYVLLRQTDVLNVSLDKLFFGVRWMDKWKDGENLTRMDGWIDKWMEERIN